MTAVCVIAAPAARASTFMGNCAKAPAEGTSWPGWTIALPPAFLSNILHTGAAPFLTSLQVGRDGGILRSRRPEGTFRRRLTGRGGEGPENGSYLKDRHLDLPAYHTQNSRFGAYTEHFTGDTLRGRGVVQELADVITRREKRAAMRQCLT